MADPSASVPRPHPVSQVKADAICELESKLQLYEVLLREYEGTVSQYQRKMRLMEAHILQLEQAVAQKSEHRVRQDIEVKQSQERNILVSDITGSDSSVGKCVTDVLEEESESASASSTDESMTPKVDASSCPPAPCKLYRGAATAHLGKAYFTPSGSDKVYKFDSATTVWAMLPDCPRSYFALAIVNGLLTAIGGETPERIPVSSLSSLMDEDSAVDGEASPKWWQHFPSMPTKRSFPTAITADIYLIVAGGGSSWVPGSGNLTTVEVFNTCDLQWFIASSLPRPVRGASAAVCGDSLYLLGGWGDIGRTVFMCLLDHLLLSCIQVPQLMHTECLTLSTVAHPHCLWSTVACVPASHSACASLDGQLVSVGGQNSRGLPDSGIYGYQPETNSWEVIGHIGTPRYHCLAVEASSGRLLVVGGLLKGGYGTEQVEVISAVRDSM